MPRRPIALRLCLAAALLALTGACVTTREREMPVPAGVVHDYIEGKPQALHPHLLIQLQQGERNRVLNAMRIGLAAMELGDRRLAAEMFDEALLRIEAVYADNPVAAQARSLWSKEAVKDFKGEPYERAMAYYYRGLLYLQDGDYENARASFRGGLLQDAFAEDEQHRADFALLAYLDGWASRCIGAAGLAEEAFADARRMNDGLALPKPGDNTLVLIETGLAPEKYADTNPQSGARSFLKFRRPLAAERPRWPASAAAPMAEPFLLEDIYRQATTRGGREVDAILAGKAQFKGASDQVGDAMLAAGVGIAAYAASDDRRNKDNEDAYKAAAALLIAGAIAKGIAAAIEPAADARYWDNLPDKVYGATLALPDGVNELPLRFQVFGAAGGSARVEIRRAGACGLGWVRSRPAFPHSPRAPNSVPPELMAQPVVIPPRPLPVEKPPQGQPEKAVERPPAEGGADPVSSFFGRMFEQIKSGFGSGDNPPAAEQGK